MKLQKRLNLNLATHPLRNRNLYFLLLISVGSLLLFVSVMNGIVYFKYNVRAKDLHASIVKTEQIKMDLQRDQRKFSVRIQDASQENEEKVDLINSLIYKKSFSWVDFLTALENSLPDSSYIVSLIPYFRGDSEIEVRFKVASPDLEELFEFTTQLESQQFKELKVMREIRDKGYLISEISITYERTH